LSTADDYDGVDMRGEVVLLTRNVKIQGEDVDGWGGQVLVTDLTESDGITERIGFLIFDHVQVYNCSQANTFKAAIRWEGAFQGGSKVSNSVIHGSMAWSVSVYKSNNVILTDSSFIGSSPIGIHLDNVRNVTVHNTFTADVLPRSNFAGDTIVDLEACVAVCSYMQLDQHSECYDL